MEHRRCGCPEQYKDMDCPACRGTGLIPPVNRDEWFAAVNEHEALRRENERLRRGLNSAVATMRRYRDYGGVQVGHWTIGNEIAAAEDALRTPDAKVADVWSKLTKEEIVRIAEDPDVYE